MYERTLGPEHSDTAQTLDNLALLRHAQGDLSRARPLYGLALAICEQALGPKHPYTAAIRSKLASSGKA